MADNGMRQVGPILFGDEDNIEDMYFTFGLGTEKYAIGIGYVTDVVGMQRAMEMPDVQPFIKGVINLHGKLIPVINVRIHFGMEEIGYTERTVIIVIDIDNVLVGLVVDHFSEVLEIPAAKIDQVSQFGGSSDSVIKGYGKQGGKWRSCSIFNAWYRTLSMREHLY